MSIKLALHRSRLACVMCLSLQLLRLLSCALLVGEMLNLLRFQPDLFFSHLIAWNWNHSTFFLFEFLISFVDMANEPYKRLQIICDSFLSQYRSSNPFPLIIPSAFVIRDEPRKEFLVQSVDQTNKPIPAECIFCLILVPVEPWDVAQITWVCLYDIVDSVSTVLYPSW